LVVGFDNKGALNVDMGDTVLGTTFTIAGLLT